MNKKKPKLTSKYTKTKKKGINKEVEFLLTQFTKKQVATSEIFDKEYHILFKECDKHKARVLFNFLNDNNLYKYNVSIIANTYYDKFFSIAMKMY